MPPKKTYQFVHTDRVLKFKIFFFSFHQTRKGDVNHLSSVSQHILILFLRNVENLKFERGDIKNRNCSLVAQHINQRCRSSSVVGGSANDERALLDLTLE